MSSIYPASVPHPGDVYASSSERVSEMRAHFPALFQGPFISCAWPIGWHALVREASAHVHELVPHIRWSQIKEKFGGLRLYYTPVSSVTDASFRGRIKWAEAESLRTCALCGDHGDLEDGSPRARLVNFTGWWLTACARCEPLITAHRSTRWWGGEE